jgi:hypothetical protein
MVWIQAREHHELSRDWPALGSPARTSPAFLGVLVPRLAPLGKAWQRRARR